MRFDHIAQQVPNIDQAIAWWQELIPDTEVLYQDETWGLIRAGEVKLAFVMSAQHPEHLAWQVSEEELERLAQLHQREIVTRRDNSRSFYIEAPGDSSVELISYPSTDLRP